MKIPFANHQLKVYKLIKNGRVSSYSQTEAATIRANIQQSTFEEVTLGLNSNPTGREWTIRTGSIGVVEVDDKLVDVDGSTYFVKSVQRLHNLIKHDQLMGVQDGI
jgi:hypothetical protein